MYLIDYFINVMVATLAGCGLVLLITSWLRRNKNAADWAMAMGALFALLGVLGLAAVMAGFIFIDGEDEAVLVIGGMSTVGVVIFTMGFAVDRVKYYQREMADDYRERVLPPQ